MRTGYFGRSIGYAAMARDMSKVKRSSDEVVRDNARRHLAERMGKLRGLPQKIGQMLSMSDDDAQADAFRDLGDRAQPLPLDEVAPILEAAWGGPIDAVVKTIDPHALAASLGQVHRAVLHDGTPVAVKVAYPGIREAVERDLKMFGWLSAPVGDLRRGFDVTDYRAEIARDLSEELDYRTELRHQQDFAAVAESLDGLVVPTVMPKRSTERVLVATWEDGDPIEEAEQWPAEPRAQLARRLLGNFLVLLFDHGMLHADPHPGNYRFRYDTEHGARVVLYDYGSVLRLSERDRLLILKLVTESCTAKGDPLATLSALGFNTDLLAPIAHKLPAVCSVLFEPFGQTYKFDLSAWNRKARLDDVLADDRWNFRMAGPAKLILLMRAFRGLLFYLERLDAPVSWERILAPILARHRDKLDRLHVPQVDGPTVTFDSLAKHLRLEVRRNGTTKVSLTLPARAIEDLASLMDPELIERIEAQGTDIDALVQSARAVGYMPIDLFTVNDPVEDKQVHVWLE